ncbi:unnamed protein product [Prunus armeniaca]
MARHDVIHGRIALYCFPQLHEDGRVMRSVKLTCSYFQAMVAGGNEETPLRWSCGGLTLAKSCSSGNSRMNDNCGSYSWVMIKS